MKRILHSLLCFGCCVALLLGPYTPAARAAGAGFNISGIPAYGEKLTLVGNGIDLSDRTWNITWYYGSGSSWTDLALYHDDTALTIDEVAAIGCNIQVVAVSVNDGSKYTSSIGPVTKGFQAAPSYIRGRPPQDGQKGYLDNLDSTQRYSYSADGGKTWSAVAEGASKVEHLNPGTYLIRVEENEWGFASEGYTVTIPSSYLDAVRTWFDGDELQDSLLDVENSRNTTLDRVVDNLVLVAKVPTNIGAGTYTGTALSWTVTPDNSGCIDVSDGTVTRPQDGVAGVGLTLTAQLVLGNETLRRDFPIVILPIETLNMDSIRIVVTASSGFRYDDETKLQNGDTLRLDLSHVEPSWVTAADLNFRWYYYKSRTGATGVLSTEAECLVNVTPPANAKDRYIHLTLTAVDNMALKVNGGLTTVGTAEAAGTYTLPTSDPQRPDVDPEPEESPTYDMELAVPVEGSMLGAGKVSYTLVSLYENGALKSDLGSGNLTEGKIPLALPAGDSRLTIQAEGYLPWVILFSDVNPEQTAALSSVIPIRMIPGKMEMDSHPYAITLGDKALFVPVYGRIVHSSAPATRTADFNSNGQVDFYDLASLLENIGTGTDGAPSGESYNTWDVKVTIGTDSVELARPVEE